jgi:hypothetical protein
VGRDRELTGGGLDMDELTELINGLIDRRERIISNPKDYGACEYKFRIDELRLLIRRVENMRAKQPQPRLRRAM